MSVLRLSTIKSFFSHMSLNSSPFHYLFPFSQENVFKSSLTSTTVSPRYCHTFIFSNITRLLENKVCPGFLQFPPLHLFTVIGFYIIFPLILLKKKKKLHFLISRHIFSIPSQILCAILRKLTKSFWTSFPPLVSNGSNV